MKRLIGALLALLSAVAFGATTLPVQLINPTGSTSGQAIVSTGSGSAPAWGAVSGASLAAQAANTVLANVTASSASPTAFTMPSCSTSASALTYTTNTGFTCNTAVNAAQLGGATFAAPGAIGGTTPGAGSFTTISATGLISPTSSIGIKGTTTNDNAQAGSIGEQLSVTGTSTSMPTSGVVTNLASLSLTAGDWEMDGMIQFTPAASTTVTEYLPGISITSASLDVFGTYQLLQLPWTTGAAQYIVIPHRRMSLGSTTTVYCIGLANFSVSTMSATCTMRARRAR